MAYELVPQVTLTDVQVDPRLIVSAVFVTAGGEQALLLSYCPPGVSLESLKRRREEGGFVFKDDASYPNWTPCECNLLYLAELRRQIAASPDLARHLPQALLGQL